MVKNIDNIRKIIRKTLLEKQELAENGLLHNTTMNWEVAKAKLNSVIDSISKSIDTQDYAQADRLIIRALATLKLWRGVMNRKEKEMVPREPYTFTLDELMSETDIPGTTMYAVKVKHDGGVMTLRTSGETEEDAIKKIMAVEGCPRNAIQSVTKIKKQKKSMNENGHYNLSNNSLLLGMNLSPEQIQTMEDIVNLMTSDVSWRDEVYPNYNYNASTVINDILNSDRLKHKDIKNVLDMWKGVNPIKIVNVLKSDIKAKHHSQLAESDKQTTYKLYRKPSNSPSPGHGEYLFVEGPTLDSVFEQYVERVRSFGNKNFEQWKSEKTDEFNNDKEAFFRTGSGSLFYSLR